MCAATSGGKSFPEVLPSFNLPEVASYSFLISATLLKHVGNSVISTVERNWCSVLEVLLIRASSLQSTIMWVRTIVSVRKNLTPRTSLSQDKAALR